MKNYLHVFLRNTGTTWILLTVEITATAAVYASAKVGGLSNLISMIIVCCIGAFLIIADTAITHSFNIAIPSYLPFEKEKKLSSDSHEMSQEETLMLLEKDSAQAGQALKPATNVYISTEQIMKAIEQQKKVSQQLEDLRLQQAKRLERTRTANTLLIGVFLGIVVVTVIVGFIVYISNQGFLLIAISTISATLIPSLVTIAKYYFEKSNQRDSHNQNIAQSQRNPGIAKSR